MGRLNLVTAPIGAAVSVADAKSHLGVSHDADDVRISDLVEAATGTVESFTGRQLMQATYDFYMDQFPPGRRIDLPKAPLSSVTSVKYQDLDDSQQTFSASYYQSVTYTELPGFVELNQDREWESTYDKADAVVVRFVAGYGTDSLSLPHVLRQAVLLFAQAGYDSLSDRKDTTEAAELLMWQFRLPSVG